MEKITYVITDKMGLHARPAGLLVKLAQKYKAKIMVQKGDQTNDAKKIFGVMSLAAKQRDQLDFFIEGEDENAAAAALQSFLRDNL